jgi:hypothetical protein
VQARRGGTGLTAHTAGADGGCSEYCGGANVVATGSHYRLNVPGEARLIGISITSRDVGAPSYKEKSM